MVLAMRHGLGLNKILGTIHAYPTLPEANKYVAGELEAIARHAGADGIRARLQRLDARRCGIRQRSLGKLFSLARQAPLLRAGSGSTETT